VQKESRRSKVSPKGFWQVRAEVKFIQNEKRSLIIAWPAMLGRTKRGGRSSAGNWNAASKSDEALKRRRAVKKLQREDLTFDNWTRKKEWLLGFWREVDNRTGGLLKSKTHYQRKKRKKEFRQPGWSFVSGEGEWQT